MISTSCCQRFLLWEFSSKRHLFRATCSFVIYNMIIDNDNEQIKTEIDFFSMTPMTLFMVISFSHVSCVAWKWNSLQKLIAMAYTGSLFMSEFNNITLCDLIGSLTWHCATCKNACFVLSNWKCGLPRWCVNRCVDAFVFVLFRL